MKNEMLPNMKWNGPDYDQYFSYVSEEAQSLVDLLAPRSGEKILDVGCGTGDLTQKIAGFGSVVKGIDFSDSMIAQARQKYPALSFEVADVRDYKADIQYDAVFSNAALHWIRPAAKVVKVIYDSLRKGGRFIAELGGKGNVRSIQSAIEEVRSALDYHSFPPPWYFPDISEYTALLEQHGFHVKSAVLFARPTKLSGKDGLRRWVELFGQSYVKDIRPSDRHNFFLKVEEVARSKLYRDGTWWADYKRLRFVAVKMDT